MMVLGKLARAYHKRGSVDFRIGNQVLDEWTR